MAAAAEQSKKPDAEGKEKTKSSKTGLIIKLAIILALAGAAVGAWFVFGKKTAPDDKDDAAATQTLPAPALYFAIDPAFVVNLNGSLDGPRYLQVEVQLMTRDPAALKSLQSNAPAIRARLLLLFSQVQPEQINQRATIEKLQADALAEVQKLMMTEAGTKCAESLLFTSFVTQ